MAKTITVETCILSAPVNFVDPTIRSLKTPLGDIAPHPFYLCVHGSYALEYLGDMHLSAKKTGMETHRIRLTLDVGEVPSGKVSLEDLPKIKSLNLKRCQKGIKDLISQIFGQDCFEVLLKNIGAIQELFDHPLFKHLNCLVFPVAEYPGQLKPGHGWMVAIRPGKVVEYKAETVELDEAIQKSGGLKWG